MIKALSPRWLKFIDSTNDHTPIPTQTLCWALGYGGRQDDMAPAFVLLPSSLEEWQWMLLSPNPFRLHMTFSHTCSSFQVFWRKCWHQPAGCPASNLGSFLHTSFSCPIHIKTKSWWFSPLSIPGIHHDRSFSKTARTTQNSPPYCRVYSNLHLNEGNLSSCIICTNGLKQ